MSYYNSYYPPRRKRALQRKKKHLIRFLCLIGTIMAVVTGFLLLNTSNTKENDISSAIEGDGAARPATVMASSYKKPPIQADLLNPNPYSRPQTPLSKVNGVVIHYVGNPGTSAKANRNYFNKLADSGSTYASSHFIIDLDGKIIQCIPTNEISYASNNRNKDTLSIEVCHPDETGKFTKESYDALISLTRWLCSQYDLDINDVIRHYDVTGKLCPLYYVEHEDAWLAFKKELFEK